VTLDGKRYVHQSFQVALDKVILLQFFTGHCIETGMKSLYYLQLFIHQIATEPDCRNAGIIEDITVNLILVDVLGKQQADDIIDIRLGRIIGETARIGHHAAIDTGSPSLIHLWKTSQLPDYTEYQVAGTAGMWLRNQQLSLKIRSQMVVDDDTLSLATQQYMVHLIKTSLTAKVNTAYQVGFIECSLHQFRLSVISQDTGSSRQPGNRIRYHIRHTNVNFLAQRAKITSKWFGVTYAADRQSVVDKIQHLIDEGVYPNKLF
jgi:hypothetical protein